jgi:hypothetical protein
VWLSTDPEKKADPITKSLQGTAKWNWRDMRSQKPDEEIVATQHGHSSSERGAL